MHEVQKIRFENENDTETTQEQERDVKNKPRSFFVTGLVLATLCILLILGFGLIRYINTKSKSDIDGREHRPPDNLTQLCNSTKWRKNEYLTLNYVVGGTYNVKTKIMASLREAIDAGIGWIIPKVSVRSWENINTYAVSYEDVSYLFDLDHMLKVLSLECPQLVIVNPYETFGLVLRHEYIPLTTYTFGEYRKALDDLMEINTVPQNHVFPVTFMGMNEIFTWHFWREPNTHKTLLDAFQFNPKLTSLADPLIKMLPSNFLGFHLRAESDSIFTNYNSSFKWFTELYSQNYSDYKNIYLATGEQSVEEKFREDMNFYNVTVFSKWTLSANNQNITNQWRNLSFDQLSVIDHQILLECDHFFGLAFSTFAYGIAMERGNMTTDGNCNCHLEGVWNYSYDCCT